jgi:hypothetical protein
MQFKFFGVAEAILSDPLKYISDLSYSAKIVRRFRNQRRLAIAPPYDLLPAHASGVRGTPNGWKIVNSALAALYVLSNSSTSRTSMFCACLRTGSGTGRQAQFVSDIGTWKVRQCNASLCLSLVYEPPHELLMPK